MRSPAASDRAHSRSGAAVAGAVGSADDEFEDGGDGVEAEGGVGKDSLDQEANVSFRSAL